MLDIRLLGGDWVMNGSMVDIMLRKTDRGLSNFLERFRRDDNTLEPKLIEPRGYLVRFFF